jgi:hypothetical protein
MRSTGADMEEKSDTPRTDAAAQFVSHFGWQVHADFARDLERELATATRERDEARAEVERMRGALRGLHDDIVEYQRINHLGGYDNHWMLAARAALAATETQP